MSVTDGKGGHPGSGRRASEKLKKTPYALLSEIPTFPPVLLHIIILISTSAHSVLRCIVSVLSGFGIMFVFMHIIAFASLSAFSKSCFCYGDDLGDVLFKLLLLSSFDFSHSLSIVSILICISRIQQLP